MEPKIFLLIAIFYMAEAKKNLLPPLIKLGIGERGEIEAKIYPLPVYVVLLPVFEIQEPKNTFFNCYKDNENREHMEAINTFSVKILDAINLLNRNLPRVLFKRRGKNMRTQTESVRKLLNQYKEEFLKKLKEKSNAFEKHSEKYKDKILEELMDLFTELKGLHQSAVWFSHKTTIETCDKTFQEEIKKASKKCQELVKKIKQCMETENAK